jgi:2Fe-2S ferredoxin
VPPEWAKRCGEPEELEVNILDFAFDVKPQSRLACQIHVTPELDGLVVRMPVRQY